MELEQATQYSNIFVGVMLTLKTLIIIANEVLKIVDYKYCRMNLKKYISLSDDIIGAIDKPVSTILIVWFIATIGTAFIK